MLTPSTGTQKPATNAKPGAKNAKQKVELPQPSARFVFCENLGNHHKKITISGTNTV